MTGGWEEVRDALRARGDAPLLTGGDGVSGSGVSGSDALAAVTTARRRLGRLPLLAGETVGVLVEPTAECLLTLLALWRSGLVAMPLDPKAPDAVLDDLARQHFRLLLHPRDAGAPPSGETPSGETLAIALEDLFTGDRRLPEAALPPTPRCPPIPGAATAVRTSGSSGRATLVVHTLRQHLASARSAAAVVGLHDGHTWLLSLPLFHVGGLAIVFRALVSGARIALPAPGEKAQHAFARLRPSHVSLVATQLGRLLDDDDGRAALIGSTAVLGGGGPFGDALRTRAVTAGVPLVVSYGMTETASMIAAERDPARVVVPGMAGRAVSGARIEIAPHGEILVGGKPVMLGYLGPEGVSDPRDARGLLATGDLGHLDDEGRLHVTGRADEMFISGGENIHPAEIESALCAFEGVEEAVVVPVDNEEFGQRPVAFVRAAKWPAPDALVAHLESLLPRFKVPDHFWPLPAEDRLKRDRAALRALARAAMDRGGPTCDG